MTDPTIIHESIVNLLLRPYQREWLEQILYNRYTYILGARQIGKSMAVSYTALCLALGYEDNNIKIPAHDVLILSKDQRTSQEMIREISNHLDFFASMGINLRHKTKGSDARIVLINGKVIRAMPGKSKSIQGFHGSVIIDELEASEAKPEDSLAQAMSVSSNRDYYRIAIVTNAGSKGGFSDLLQTSEEEEWEIRRSKFAMSTTSIYDAYPDGLPPHIEDMKKIMASGAWQRFYLNMSVEGSETLFTPDELKECKEELSIKSYQTILAIDPGFTNNPSGVVIIKAGGGKANILYASHWHKVPMEEQISMIQHLMKEYKVSKLIVDQGTQGWQMARTLEKMYPTITKAISANSSLRNRSGATLKRLVQERAIHIPNIQVLIEDLQSIIVDEKKNIVIPERPGPDKCKIHGDTADALLYVMDDIASTYETKSNIKPMSFQNSYSKMW